MYKIELDTFQLREGMEGAEVLASQRRLIDAGYHETPDGRKLVADASYGPIQTEVVRTAQADMAADEVYHSTVDGDLGPATLTALLDKVGYPFAAFDQLVEDATAELEEDTSDDADDDYDDLEADFEGDGNAL